jgi:hypothetical protein
MITHIVHVCLFVVSVFPPAHKFYPFTNLNGATDKVYDIIFLGPGDEILINYNGDVDNNDPLWFNEKSLKTD